MRAMLVVLMLCGATSCGTALAGPGPACDCPAVKQPHLIVAATGQDLGIAFTYPPADASAFNETVGGLVVFGKPVVFRFVSGDCSGEPSGSRLGPLNNVLYPSPRGTGQAFEVTSTSTPGSVTIGSELRDGACLPLQPAQQDVSPFKVHEITGLPAWVKSYRPNELTIELR